MSAGTTLAIVAAMGGGVAYADPAASPVVRQINLVGSDTLTPVVNALAEDANALALGSGTPVRKVASWDATGSTNIGDTNGATAGCDTIARPDGSSAGRTTLLANIANGCLQGARSSSLNTGSASPALGYVPFASEAITFAITNTSSFPKNMTLADVKGYFLCTRANLFGASPFTTAGVKNYRAMLPQVGSGTRDYWRGAAVVDYGTNGFPNIQTPSDTSNPTCVENGKDENNTAIQEHDGRQVNNFEIVPYSVGQWQIQAAGVIDEFGGEDKRGATRLGQIDSKNPFSSNFGLQRDLYLVFPLADLNASSPATDSNADVIQQLFKGSSSKLCATGGAAQAIVLRFGLRGPNTASCGAVVPTA